MKCLRARASRPFVASPCAPRQCVRQQLRCVRAFSAAPEDMNAAMAKMMQDPEMAEKMKAVQSMMQKPEVQQQMAEMTAYMQNQKLQQRLQELKDDPELKGMIEDIKQNGMGAMMKYWNDPETLAKLGEKLGDIQAPPSVAAAAAGPPGAGMAPPPMPDVENLLDAAKYGDMEAVEDFIAIGKDVNMRDGESRSPLHYAVAYNHAGIVAMLLNAGADINALDSKQNTPLHYAAGYGRLQQAQQLLDAGADVAAKNATGKVAADLIRMEPRNPLNSEEALMQRLTAA